MLVVVQNRRASIDELYSDKKKKRIAKARKNIIKNEIKIGKKNRKSKFYRNYKITADLRELISNYQKIDILMKMKFIIFFRFFSFPLFLFPNLSRPIPLRHKSYIHYLL